MEICRKAKASAQKGRQLQAASSFPATADEPSEAPAQSAPPPIAAEPVVPPPAVEKRYRLPSGQKIPAADLYKRAQGEDEVLPERELNLDSLVLPPLVRLHQRLSRRSELLKLHLKHYHMSTWCGQGL